MEEKSLLRDANLEIIPQQYYDEESQTYKVVANGDTSGVDFSKKSLLRDANLEIIPQQYYDVGLGKFVIGTLSTGGGSGGTATQGPPGADGEDGKSAYEVALENGFVGSEQQWLESLVGPQGPQGLPGKDGNDATLILPLSADDVADTTSRVLVSSNEKAQIGANSTDIQSHSTRISDLENALLNTSGTDEKVKMNTNGVASYLEELIDGTTVVNENERLKVPFVEALSVTPQEINALTGVTSNIQAQIDGLSNITDVREIVETEANLPLPVPGPDITILVRQDSTQDGATTFYISNDTDWVYVNKIDSGLARNFTTNPIDLNTETIGVLPKARYEKQDAAETPFLDVDNNIAARNVSDALKELFLSASNVKTSWANVAGFNLNKNNTAQEFVNETLRLKNKFANNLIQKGVNAHPSNRLEEMIDKVPSIPNVSLGGAIKRTPRANYTAGTELRIPLSQSFALSDIATTPIEYLQGMSDITHYSASFNESDRNNFTLNKYVEFDGKMKLKTFYEIGSERVASWNEAGVLYKTLIERDKWSRIDKLDIVSQGTTTWQPSEPNSPIEVINPVWRNSGTLVQSVNNSNGYSMTEGRALGTGVFYYEILKNSGSTSNNRTGLVNTTGSFNYGSATYHSSGLTSIPAGTRIGILIDLRSTTGGRARYTRDGTTWTDWRTIQGATGTTLLGTLYIALNNSSSGTTAKYTVNVGGSTFQYAIPREFSAELREIYSFDGQMVYKVNNKMFILNDGEYKYYNSGWQSVSNTLPTLTQFGMNGMNSLTPLLDRVDGVSPIDLLEGDLEVYALAEDTDTVTLLEMNAVPIQQLEENSVDIPLGGIDSIDKFELEANETAKIAISFDSGVTWLAYDEGTWVEADNAHEGMTALEFNALTTEQIAEIRNNKDFIRFQFSLSNDAEFDELRIKVSLQGVEQILPPDAYELDYDSQNKTIIYTLKRDMTLSVNYVDG